jgi:hypothetical protein
MRFALVSLFAAQKWKPSVDELPCSPEALVAAVRDRRARVREQLRSNSSALLDRTEGIKWFTYSTSQVSTDCNNVEHPWLAGPRLYPTEAQPAGSPSRRG